VSRLHRLIAAAYSNCWAIRPDVLRAIIDVLAFQADGGRLSPQEVAQRIGDRKTAPPAGAGVAILPLYGLLGHRMNQVQDTSGPGGTSTEQFGQWFDGMVGDASISAIVIDVDSPGGVVPGTPELAQKIYEARGIKPVVAIASSMAASAAYWIAAAAEEFWVIPSGDVGNIGVYGIHEDCSAMEAESGIKTTIISAGKYKVEGNPHEPLTDEAAKAMQARADSFYDDFTKAISVYRGVDQDQVINGFGEGRIVRAKDAKKQGMVDKVGTLDQLLVRLGAKGPRSKMAATAPGLSLVASAPSTQSILAGGASDSSTADVAAAPVVVPLHAEPAPEAKELSMSDKDNSAAIEAGTAAVAAAAAQKAEEARLDGLLALASEHSIPMATVLKWRKGGTSIEAAQAEILTELKTKHAAAPALTPSVRVGETAEHGKTGPFRTLGEQLMAGSLLGMGKADERTRNMLAAASGASATVGTDGGFLIQKEFTTDLLESTFKAGDILSRVDSTEIGANADGLEVVYLDEVSRATGSRWGGIQVYRAAEADSVTGKKPQLGKWECRLEDILGAAYMTERLLQDAQGMQDVFQKGFAEEFTFKSEDEIFRGNGAGQMLGILTALYSATAGASLGPTVSVAKESTQTADTVIFDNIEKMWLRVHPRSRAKGAWFVNIEVEPQLAQLQVGIGVSGQLVYMPPGGLSGAPYATLKGRPVIPCEYSSGLGDVGDIVFADFSRFKVITKGGLQSDESIHVRFLNNERTFRWVTRINGKPKDKTAITPYKATDSTLRLSPFVTLAAR